LGASQRASWVLGALHAKHCKIYRIAKNGIAKIARFIELQDL
jgi:hypothetical protein